MRVISICFLLVCAVFGKDEDITGSIFEPTEEEVAKFKASVSPDTVVPSIKLPTGSFSQYSIIADDQVDEVVDVTVKKEPIPNDAEAKGGKEVVPRPEPVMSADETADEEPVLEEAADEESVLEEAADEEANLGESSGGSYLEYASGDADMGLIPLDDDMIISDQNATLLPTLTSDTVGIRIGVIDAEAEAAQEAEGETSITYAVTDEESAPLPGMGAGGGGGLGGIGDMLGNLFGGKGFMNGGGSDDYDAGFLKCFACDSCPEGKDAKNKMRKETCTDFSALCVTKTSYTMRRGKLFYVRQSRFCGPSECPPNSLMSRFKCCSGELCNSKNESPSCFGVNWFLLAVCFAVWHI